MSRPDDPFGALLDEDFSPVPGRPGGPLAGTTFVVKDLLAVAGHTIGAGQPTWAATHTPEEAHAPAVKRLLDAGADLVARAHTAEMAYSLSGGDVRAGMPTNPAHPDLDPGASSTGSAVAVAGGLADLGLGTDTLGSVRVPAAYVGVFGWRPTYGRVPAEGVHPLAISLDTVGLLARDPGHLRLGAEALVAGPLTGEDPTALVLAEDGFALLDEADRAALAEVAAELGADGSVELAPTGRTLRELTLAVRDVQGPEFAAAYRDWIAAAAPEFTTGVGERIAHALQVTPEEHAAALDVRDDVRRHIERTIPPGTVVLAPAAGRPAPREADARAQARARHQAAALSVVGSLAGLPTVTVPGTVVAGAPLGLSLVGRPGDDGLLLRLAEGRPPVAPARRPGSA